MTQPSAPFVAAASPRRRIMMAGAVIGLAVILAYANSLHGPFVYDDGPAITDNPTLRTWWRVDRVLIPPPNTTVSGRPVLNASLALNYAISGTGVWSYHLLNVFIHALAALTLFGLVRRTLPPGISDDEVSDRAAPTAKGRTGPLVPIGAARPSGLDSTWWAVLAALVWALHPLATEGVNYVVQRAESLMALFMLVTLYCFARAAGEKEPRRARRWLIASVVSCACGMATKENMAAAPILVLLYDRVFASGALARALRRRTGYYLALASTWLIVAGLLATTGGDRGGTVGFGTVSPLAYWLTQSGALVRYLALTVWPAPLVFDYGTPWVRHLAEVWPPAFVVATLVVVTGWALVRNRPAGFLGAACFAILAPTSLVPGVSQIIVEHRMYLPLAALVLLGGIAVKSLLGIRVAAAAGVVIVAFFGLTAFRNTAYQTATRLWSDTAAKRPDNARAYFHLASGEQEAGHLEAAVRLYEKAIAVYPGYLEARNNLGNALCELGRSGDAIPQYEAALKIAPRSAVTHNNLANALNAVGRPGEAVPHYERAIELGPNYREANANLGATLMRLNRPADAVRPLERAVALDPQLAAGHAELADALARSGRAADALPHYEAALRGDAHNAELRGNFAGALADLNRLEDALVEFERAVALRPDSVALHFNYGATLLAAGRVDDAVKQFEAALELQPDFTPARAALEQIRRR